MKKANLGLLGSIHRFGNLEGQYDELTLRQIPLFFDYLHPQPSHLLDLTLTSFFTKLDTSPPTQTALPSITCPAPLPPAHHLVYFPPQVTLSQLLPDGTDILHSPGAPFNRRLWGGGSVTFGSTNKLLLDGSRAVCVEGIRDVTIKGETGQEKVVLKIQRRIGKVPSKETEFETRKRIWSNEQDAEGHTAIIENRNLVFMRDKTPDQLEHDKSKFLQPSRKIKCYRNLLVHGPLTLTLLLTAIRHHLHGKGLAIMNIDYKNLAPLYVEEELAICGKPKPTKEGIFWDVWIEGKDSAMDDFWSLPPVSRTLTALTFVESALVHSQSISYYLVPFIPKLLFKFRSEIWRVGTPFLLTDPKLNFVFDLYFLYTYSSRLESGSPRFSTPGSFFVYVLFVATVIMDSIWGPGCSHRDNKGTRTMFFVVEIPTLLLPWARLALTFVVSGWYRASIEFTGIVAAHLYDFLTRIYPTFGGGKNYISTPGFVRRWFTRSLRGGQERVYGQAFRPPNEDGESSSGWTSAVRGAWDSRGSGRRLGGN
ncbi:hypothetical protein BJY04DRAFT_206694 [Aspergillus karnatakaensis]|uniref:uncharacterized protein n=1 Tax=Aspergillus karnatakaensis TaxID=1810916 RepID=UPI003CCD6BA7